MEKRLSEAALQGDLESLRQILEKDSLILDRIIVSRVSETPLHIASNLGHLNLVKEFLIRKPELASELESTGSSPLHLAAAKGHVDIVEELLRADDEVCLVRNFRWEECVACGGDQREGGRDRCDGPGKARVYPVADGSRGDLFASVCEMEHVGGVEAFGYV